MFNVTALIGTIILVIAAVSGFAGVYSESISFVEPMSLKIFHNIIGQMAYFLGIISLCCAYYSNWMVLREKLTPEVRFILTVITLFITMWSMSHPIKSLYHYVETLSDSK